MKLVLSCPVGRRLDENTRRPLAVARIHRPCYRFCLWGQEIAASAEEVFADMNFGKGDGGM